MTTPGNDLLLPARRGEALLATALVGLLLLMLMPLPPLLMDTLLAANISFSLLLLCISMYLARPLEFSVFPTMLLLSTLFRLGLNVATTRLIMLNGHQGTQAAGHVIETFGSFVVGGNFVVGGIVFFILVIINFVVITKGAGRVAEVAARFTLDAMPGKQMAIDAELASGAINEEEAKLRRRDIEREADFYGAMDGSSKFVRGDAIAGLIITAINIVGGLIVGMGQHALPLAGAAKTYTLLTIGDGLVSQIPALMVSTAAGVVVTRAASGGPLAGEIAQQVGHHRRALRVIALLLGALGLIPGMPTLVLWLLAGVAYYVSRRPVPETTPQQQEQQQVPDEDAPEVIRQMLPVDTLELEIGYGLVRLVQGEKQDLLKRIKAIRRQLALELGIVVPPVHIRDNLRLEADAYRFLLRGVEVGRGVLHADRLMAMAPGEVTEAVEGIPGKEPAFGMDALWIEPGDRQAAEAAGYTVVDCSTVVATHLTELLRGNAADLLGRQEVQELVEVVAQHSPKLVEELIPGVLTVGDVGKVLKLLLSEGVSIRDLATILETLGDEAAGSRDPLVLVEAVRRRLRKAICQKLADEDGRLHAIMLDGATEAFLRQGLVTSERGRFISIDLNLTRLLINRLQSQAVNSPAPPLLVTSPDLRRPLFELLYRFLPQLTVLSHEEVQPRLEVRTVGVVSLRDALATAEPGPEMPGQTLSAGQAVPVG
ncbi:MAG: flagellar biosynthesis protein FlhA [Deltaproteobacteria bacterium]|nr:MAG: flagellar biosynthesis protein FlhA [Deltaproteobacteria bacterium]